MMDANRKEAMKRGEDRISSLPDPILQYILTMMPLRSAIRTDVLSKRWRNLWQYSLLSATSLDFGEDFSCSQSSKDFVETVNRYLLINSSKKLESFRVFFCPFDLFSPDMESWVNYVTGKRVEHLDINLSQGFRCPLARDFTDERSPFLLPASLFDCDSLSDLSLSRCNFSYPLNLSNFRGLKSLALADSNINDDMLGTVLTDCHMLESLSLTNCQQLGAISITHPELNLNKLTVGDCRLAYLLEIDAPTLRSFQYFGTLCNEIDFLDISSLTDASFHSIERNFNDDYMEILSDLSHVHILTLCKETLLQVTKAEELELHEFPILLPNLQEMQILMDSMTNEDLTLIYSFLHLCPCPFIDKLFIKLPETIDDPNEPKYAVRIMLTPREVTLDHLKAVKLTNFKGCINEMRLVRFLLEKAKFLESLVLVLPSASNLKGRHDNKRLALRILHGQVSLLPKISHCARIIIHEFEEDDGFNPTHSKIHDSAFLPVIPCLVAG